VSRLLQRLVRSIPAVRGKQRLARLLLGDLHGAAVVKDRFGFAYQVPDLREPIGFHLLINSAYEPEVQDLLLSKLHPGDVFIDVGANIGTFTIPAARRVGSSGRVVAIEASPEIFNNLKKNVAVNDVSNVELICAAAGASNDNSEFYPAPIDHFGMGSRAPQFNAAAISVPGVTLDSLVERLKLPSVDLIKIDVEGFELDVLKGASGLIESERPPLIIFEFCDWAEARMRNETVGAAQRFLMEKGFQIWPAGDYKSDRPVATAITVGSEILVAAKY
jgi:FkbM family methyltransferase